MKRKGLVLGIFTALPSLFILISTSIMVFSVVIEKMTGNEMQLLQKKNLESYIFLIEPYIAAIFIVANLYFQCVHKWKTQNPG